MAGLNLCSDGDDASLPTRDRWSPPCDEAEAEMERRGRGRMGRHSWPVISTRLTRGRERDEPARAATKPHKGEGKARRRAANPKSRPVLLQSTTSPSPAFRARASTRSSCHHRATLAVRRQHSSRMRQTRLTVAHSSSKSSDKIRPPTRDLTVRFHWASMHRCCCCSPRLTESTRLSSSDIHTSRQKQITRHARRHRHCDRRDLARTICTSHPPPLHEDIIRGLHFVADHLARRPFLTLARCIERL